MICDIRKINNLETLIGYFSTILDWNINLDDLDDIEDAFFYFTPEELDLTEEHSAKITSIKQLRPLCTNQPFGIFSVEFESKALQVTALRKILLKLVRKSRNANHPMWEKNDLLFLCFWGNSDNRTVGVAYFSDNENNLSILKTIYCAPKFEVIEQLNRFESRLANLAWVSDTSKVLEWREKWSKAFTTQYGETIKNSKVLARELAQHAQRTRKYIHEIYNIETANGYVHLLFKKFKDNLIHDLSIEQFADMYAQTVTYGLFSARCMDTDGRFKVDEVVDRIPNTNPFLKDLMKECFTRKKGRSLSFDELELDEIVRLLDNTNTEKILDDFNRQTGEGREDPVIYFYEGFLAEYESEQKKRRGVYYTPQSAVKFIVGAVDDILKTEFHYKDGLADTATKNKIIDVPAIQILDPATGTGTFLRQVIIQIWENFIHENKHLPQDKVNELWNDYVPKHLLPRLNGFELMMAPYAVAHMKLALVLKETGYNFKGKERINVFLTNFLEEAGSATEQLTFFENDPLAMESICADRIKKNASINVIIGNPPYSKVSSNNDIPYIVDMLKGILPTGERTSNYYEIDGKPLGEIKVWLQDDYVKFIRYSQYLLERKKTKGVIAFITNNGFLDNPTFRGMRQQLIETFFKIYILNLNGGASIKRAFDGKDENVFDIRKNVSINIFVYDPSKKSSGIYYKDLFGTRNHKYNFLNECAFNKVNWKKIVPNTPFYLLIPQNQDDIIEYNKGISIDKIMPLFCTGITTSRDNLAIDINKEILSEKIETFCDVKNNSDDEIRNMFKIGDARDWSLHNLRIKYNANKTIAQDIIPITYRPFDNRYICYTKNVVSWTRYNVMSNMIKLNNIAFLTARINKSDNMDHFFCTNLVSETKTCEYTTNSSIFPLYYLDKIGIKQANLSDEFVKLVSSKTNIQCAEITPENMLDYIYGIVFSPTYRTKYKEYLRLDFPKIPVTSNQKLFRELVTLGNRLRNLHINGINRAPTSTFVSSGNNTVKIVKYYSCNEFLFINKESYFTGITESVYKFTVGGYQICNKYLKDRKGRVLLQDEIEHLINTFDVIDATIATMGEIDVVIKQNGGFPIE